MVGVQINPVAGLPSGFPVSLTLSSVLFQMFDFLYQKSWSYIRDTFITGIASVCPWTRWRQKCRSLAWGMWCLIGHLQSVRPFIFSDILCLILFQPLLSQGLLEARHGLRPLLLKSSDRLKDLLFLDIALDSTVRRAIERGYEELNNAGPEVNPAIFTISYVPNI